MCLWSDIRGNVAIIFTLSLPVLLVCTGLAVDYVIWTNQKQELQRIADEVRQADLVVSAVMVAGRRAPVVIRESMVQAMTKGSVIVDIAIDQGGSVEHIRATSYEQPVYRQNGVLYHAVPNMPGAVPRTASQALSSAILPYVIELIDKGVDDSSLKAATAVQNGIVVDPVLREELGL